MKKQYCKKLTAITLSKLDNDYDVWSNTCIETRNEESYKIDGLGPYPVTKVNRSTVQVLRSNSLFCIRRSKVKLLKDRTIAQKLLQANFSL